MLSEQSIFNAAIGLITSLGAWLMRTMWQDLRELQLADKQLSEKVSQIEVVVAGQYVKRDELQKLSDAIFAKLDRIEDKLDGKADK